MTATAKHTPDLEAMIENCSQMVDLLPSVAEFNAMKRSHADLYDAAGAAITALAFAAETYWHIGDAVAFAQTMAAKNALIAAQDMSRGRDIPVMKDVTPHVAKAVQS